MSEIERREFLEGAYLRVSFLLFRNKMPLQDSTNKQTRSPRRDVKDVLGRRSRDRGEGLSTLTPRVNDNSTSQQSFERVCETKSRAPALAQKTVLERITRKRSRWRRELSI